MSPLAEMYVDLVKKGIKNLEDVPNRYKEEVENHIGDLGNTTSNNIETTNMYKSDKNVANIPREKEDETEKNSAISTMALFSNPPSPTLDD